MLDLRGLNCYLCPLIYKMLMVPKVKQAINVGDWFATIDLKVTYWVFEFSPSASLLHSGPSRDAWMLSLPL